MDVILFGAGASYGSDSSGTPPLGDDLFEALRAFNPPGWGALPSEMSSEFRGDFEAGVTAVAERHPHALPPLQRAMAAYFFNFLPQITSLYVALAHRIRDSAWDGSVCSLNYERMLELSLGHVGLQPVVNSPSEAGKRVELCLPHGCCHLFCDSVKGAAGAVSFAGVNVKTDGPVRPIVDPVEFQSRIEGDAFPPVMSYFEPQKRTTAGASFIQTQRQRWTQLADEAETIAVVGIRVRPRDDHIWNPLATSDATVVYCGGPSAARQYEAWAASERSGSADVVLDSYFADAFDEICESLGI